VIDVGANAGLWNYRGYRLVSVTVFGQSLTNVMTPVRVLTNQTLMGGLNLMAGNYQGQILFANAPWIVGQNLNSVGLAVDGAAHIDRVEIRLQPY
jgi:hypothetical protein